MKAYLGALVAELKEVPVTQSRFSRGVSIHEDPVLPAPIPNNRNLVLDRQFGMHGRNDGIFRRIEGDAAAFTNSYGDRTPMKLL